LGYFSPAFSFYQPNGNFQEIELSRIAINSSRNQSVITTDTNGKVTKVLGMDRTNVAIGLRYEYDYRLFKKKDDCKLKSYLGIAVNPYFSSSTFDPNSTIYFTTRQQSIGATIAFMPRLNYYISERWFLDLNIPISIMDMNITTNKVDNPILSEQQRSVSTVNFSQLPCKFLVRFWVGFRV
jgi:hypothetical protein